MQSTHSSRPAWPPPPVLTRTDSSRAQSANPRMPELPEVEAWRRALDGPVSAFPVPSAAPAHVATLETFDPPLRSLVGRTLFAPERRSQSSPVPRQARERA